MHHSRRKSGHGHHGHGGHGNGSGNGSANTSMTDLRAAETYAPSTSSSRHKQSRPAPMTRRSTPQSAGKLGKSPRDREREWDEERWGYEERESFPQYCMTCEKQFIPQVDLFLYCSETCRMHDHSNTPSSATTTLRPYVGNSDSYSYYSSVNSEPKDIVPRASPSRPNSMHYSSPAPATASHTSALSALRSLSIRDPSPPSPTLTNGYHGTIWPFTRSAAVSPSTSYSRPTSTIFSSTYDAGYYGAGVSPAVDRPLPPRRPGTYSRPKSIELLTPTW